MSRRASTFTPGPLQRAILRTCAETGSFECRVSSHYHAALKLHSRGLISRDLGPRMATRFLRNEAGAKWIAEHDGSVP
jgi:hypothetical protein